WLASEGLDPRHADLRSPFRGAGNAVRSPAHASKRGGRYHPLAEEAAALIIGDRQTPLHCTFPQLRERHRRKHTVSAQLDPRIVPDARWPGMYRIRRSEAPCPTWST